jgi:hypothetical protein
MQQEIRVGASRFFRVIDRSFLLFVFDRRVAMMSETKRFRGETTELQRTQWQSNAHADPMEDSPFTMAALLLVLAFTTVMAGLVIWGVL